MDGSDSDQTRSVRKWAMRLAHALRLAWPPIPHHLLGRAVEHLPAQQLLEGDEPRRGESSGEDAAAAVILRSYLDSQNTGDRADFGRIDLPPKTDTETLAQ